MPHSKPTMWMMLSSMVFLLMNCIMMFLPKYNHYLNKSILNNKIKFKFHMKW